MLEKVGKKRAKTGFIVKCPHCNMWTKPKKMGFWSNPGNKSGQKKSGAFSENGTFLAFLGHFWPICAN
ncbi:hypothetical protein [Anaerotruncus colihominis]|uniref:hypothetical protein n=1 Tax=Anaerotruncus colihominis TaxID=169435 RepID=UPI0013A5F93A|nr:hypothetical protein [Anaerotruncus colihominis]